MSAEIPAPLAPEREAEIRARVEDPHLTAGPWRLEYESCDCDYPCGHGLYPSAVVTDEPTPWAVERAKQTGEAPRDYDFHRSEMADFTHADWELMAHARQDVPALLAALNAERERSEKLRRRLAAAEGDLLDIRGLLSPSGAPRRVPMELGERVAPAVEWLLGEVERLRTELERQTTVARAEGGAR